MKLATMYTSISLKRNCRFMLTYKYLEMSTFLILFNNHSLVKCLLDLCRLCDHISVCQLYWINFNVFLLLVFTHNVLLSNTSEIYKDNLFNNTALKPKINQLSLIDHQCHLTYISLEHPNSIPTSWNMFLFHSTQK